MLHNEGKCRANLYPQSSKAEPTREGGWRRRFSRAYCIIRWLRSFFWCWHTPTCVLLKGASWLGRSWRKPVDSHSSGSGKSGLWPCVGTNSTVSHSVAPAAAPWPGGPSACQDAGMHMEGLWCGWRRGFRLHMHCWTLRCLSLSHTSLTLFLGSPHTNVICPHLQLCNYTKHGIKQDFELQISLIENEISHFKKINKDNLDIWKSWIRLNQPPAVPIPSVQVR